MSSTRNEFGPGEKVRTSSSTNTLLMNSKSAKEGDGKEKKCARPLSPTLCRWIQNLDATLERQII